MTVGDPYRGVFPVAPTTFFDNGDLKLVSQRRALDCMIDQQVDGTCILANYSEQSLLDDAERDPLVPRAPETRAGLLALAHAADVLALRWSI